MNLRHNNLEAILESNVSLNIGHALAVLFIGLSIYVLNLDKTVFYWLGVMLSLTLIRFFVFKQTLQKLRLEGFKLSHEYLVSVLIIFMAIGWSALSFFYLEHQNPETNLLILVTILGVVLTSMSFIIFIKNIYLLFVFIIIMPVFINTIQMPELAYKIFALQVLVYLAYVFRHAFVFHKKIEDNLKLLSSNAKLIQDLKNDKKVVEQACELKSQFLANMSHEIRTPMNGIMGFLQVLLASETDAKKKGYLETISKSTDELLEIINRVLDFSKLESHNLTLNKTAFNPLEAIKSCIELYSQHANKQNIVIKLEVLDDLPNKIVSDEVRLKQVINNLISNAIKFSHPNSEILLKAAYIKEQGQTPKLCIDVIDFGIGIAEKKLEFIFDSFTQVDNSDTRQYSGTGLGLSICAHLVELMGGKIEVQSIKSRGSKFSFYIDAP